ncbi:hypothetical protein M758_UG160000 [Ceratodon purpureus]|nr:hypothetical protein M758_UG160000 [Ceratodon purpureus]
MRSNLYSFAGLLPILLLAATLGSFGHELYWQEGFLWDPSLLHFAKRRPATVTGGTYGQNFAHGPLPSTVLSATDGSTTMSPSATPFTGDTSLENSYAGT